MVDDRSAPKAGAGGKRLTIADIAARAGLSKVSVSYALNGRPGVSATTRGRVLAIAREMGWSPNSAARALSASRSGIIGLVLGRSPRLLGVEPFYMELIGGVESVLTESSAALLLKVVPDPGDEARIYREWWNSRRVDGVIVTDVRTGDDRLAALADIGMPAVVIGSSPTFATDFATSTLWTDDVRPMEAVVRYLAGLGHRRLARVSGPPTLAHCAERTDVFRRTAAGLGLEPTLVIEADFTGEKGAQATREALLARERPTAIIFDNDVMAVAAVGVAGEMGISVPRDLSLIAWNDSALCTLTHPPLSAMSRDIPAIGADAARLLLDGMTGAAPVARETPPYILTPRGTTAPAPTEPPPSGGVRRWDSDG
ncbi:LacI family DNA-binding transcriptional regulator [Mangrovihabitans endophyticus]|uniref:LacI family transcriptional regulator n=1 Tax=Mangrovihabitans endophyticus TaxID=1751298 RepID=A0A8J3BU25_9ACTN|nr:LacI family DNA-binding transcriptional regulator [Mangrovihabitans endophyticus]GGK78505.1 LacI family transcriptional regulator [Mangrovihabitans endophyticus]